MAGSTAWFRLSNLRVQRQKAVIFLGGSGGGSNLGKGITVSGKIGSKYTWPQPEVKWTCASGCKSRRININCKHVWVIIKHGLLDNSPSSRSIVFPANQTSIYSCFFHVFFHMFLWFYFFFGGVTWVCLKMGVPRNPLVKDYFPD